VWVALAGDLYRVDYLATIDTIHGNDLGYTHPDYAIGMFAKFCARTCHLPTVISLFQNQVISELVESRARPTDLGDDFEKVGRLESSTQEGFKSSALLALLKNEGVGIESIMRT